MNTDKETLIQFITILESFGFSITYDGMRCLDALLENYNLVETAGFFTLISMAEIFQKKENQKIDIHARLAIYTSGILEVLKEYKDKKVYREELWKNDSTAFWGMANLSPNQPEWVETVLKNHPVPGHKIAVPQFDYKEGLK